MKPSSVCPIVTVQFTRARLPRKRECVAIILPILQIAGAYHCMNRSGVIPCKVYCCCVCTCVWHVSLVLSEVFFVDSNFSWMNTCLNDITQFSDFIGHQYISLWLNLKLLLIVRKCLSALSLSWPDTSCQHATIFLIVLHTVGHSEGQQKDQRGDLIHPCFSTIHTNRNAPEFKVPLDVEEKQVVQTFCK